MAALTEEIKEQLEKYEMDGWLEDWDVECIAHEVSKLEPGQTYLEIGVARGVSSTIACLWAKEGVKVKGIDIINWADREQKMKGILNHFGKNLDMWEFLEGESQIMAKYWKGGMIDLLFIDGDHTYEGVLKDIISWLPWVKKGGTIMFDDYNDKTGVKQAIIDTIKDHSLYQNYSIDNEMFILRV
jgi:predicted O-methyltransferase YrrM